MSMQTVCLFIVCIGQTIGKNLAILEVRKIIRDLTFITIRGLGKNGGSPKCFGEFQGAKLLAFWVTQKTNFLMWVSDRRACEN